MAVGADAIVRETHHAKSLFAPLMYLLGPQNWVSSFHAQNHSHGKLRTVFCLCPCLHMFGELTRAFQLTCLSTLFEDFVVGQELAPRRKLLRRFDSPTAGCPIAECVRPP